MSNPIIRRHEAFTIVGVGGRFISVLSPEATNQEVIPHLWHSFINRMSEVTNRVGSTTWGACIIPPRDERENGDELRYVAGTHVDGTGGIPDGMEAVTIPEATYAVFTHEGAIERIGETMDRIYGEWLPASGYRRGPSPDLERYDERFTGSDDSVMEVWVPIIR